MDAEHRDKNVPALTAARVRPALWGGLECSITRVQNRYLDQFQLSGHYNRPTDIDLIADLGIEALRYPVLYEKHCPEYGQPIDWTWADERLNLLRDHNINPIVGLVHHGSGPAYTSMMKQNFATGLATFAEKVAERFPFIDYYTPVNEPLTTARFSGLYGLWYPHHKNDRSFCRMLLNELKAVVLSMQAIRKINPTAKLVQTEDLGKVYAAKNLQYQARFENERRWTTFDFLCGRVDPDHYLWQYFIDNGITFKELEFFLENPCPPDILGLNYYITSERFLDDNLAGYPPHMHGGNHIEKYVDTEAIRVDHDQPCGLGMLLREVHERYSLPMAMTEVHLNCTREEQMRWFKQVWEVCCRAREEGIQMEAVTAWSIFGAYGWNKLLTSPECDYEPGVYDLRAEQPRPTALIKLMRNIAGKGKYDHPVLHEPGWWQRTGRYYSCDENTNDQYVAANRDGCDYLMIIGDNEVAEALMSACELRAIPFRRVNNAEYLSGHNGDGNQPWAVIHSDKVALNLVNSTLDYLIDKSSGLAIEPASGLFDKEVEKEACKVVAVEAELMQR